MAWDNTEVRQAYQKMYVARKKLELALARAERGLDPRTGHDPQAFVSSLRMLVEQLEQDYEARKRGEHVSSE